ncbi:hypothetical protein ACSI5I_003569 [Vibrio vulnificus]
MKSFKHVLASLTLIAGVMFTPAQAKEAPELSDRTFRTVNKVQELIATEKYSDALERLADALKGTTKNYDRAVLLQQTGFLYSLKEDYKNAAKYFAESLKLDALPVPVAQQVRYSLAQLYLSEAKYRQSVETMKTWFDIANTTDEKPQAHAYITLASAYVQMEDYKNAIAPTKQAIAMSKNPSESWYLLLMASHYELKQLKEVAEVLKILTTQYPEKKRYWMQLSGIYMELNQERNALSALEMAHKMGLLDEEKELLRLVNFLAYQNIPFRAAKTMQAEMEKGNVTRNQENLERLASFWQQAKELDKAIETYQQAYALAPNAQSQIRIVRLMLQDKQFTDATEFAATPAADAKLDQKAELEYVRGLAYFELKDSQRALRSMQSAAQSEKMRQVVSPWITFLASQG